MNKLFDQCVEILNIMAKLCHMTYEEINIYIFVIIHPLLTLFFMIISIYYFRKYKLLKKALSNKN